MTLNRDKTPSSFRSLRHTGKYKFSIENTYFNSQSDLESQQATVEFQVSKAFQKTHAFYKKLTFQFPEWHRIAKSPCRVSGIKGIPKNEVFYKKLAFPFPEWPWIATVEFQVSKANRKNTSFQRKTHVSILRMTSNRNKPPSSFRSLRHTQKYECST